MSILFEIQILNRPYFQTRSGTDIILKTGSGSDLILKMLTYQNTRIRSPIKLYLLLWHWWPSPGAFFSHSLKKVNFHGSANLKCSFALHIERNICIARIRCYMCSKNIRTRFNSIRENLLMLRAVNVTPTRAGRVKLFFFREKNPSKSKISMQTG